MQAEPRSASDGIVSSGKSGRISLLYHTGAGGTKVVAELLRELLSPEHDTRIANIHDPEAATVVGESDFLVVCFPTYYLKPSASMTEFILNLPRSDSRKTAYIVATDELYTENCIRTCALLLKSRGIRTAGSVSIRAPGSDVTCMIPAMLCGWLYRFEKNFHRKLESAAGEISSLARDDDPKEKIPVLKWYTPFTQLIQILFLNHVDGMRKNIRSLPERCTGCGVCAAECGRNAWIMEGSKPRHVSDRCELCTRCIHRCPRKAIVLIKALRDNPRLDGRLYGRLKDETKKLLEPARSKNDSRIAG